jgi:hypothetical protein
MGAVQSSETLGPPTSPHDVPTQNTTMEKTGSYSTTYVKQHWTSVFDWVTHITQAKSNLPFHFLQ